MELINSVPEVIAVIIALAGLLISIVGLPGVILVFLGSLIWSASNSFNYLTWPWLFLFLIMAIASTLVDNLAVILGAKKYGASNWGIVGCIVGIIVGTIVANIPGLLVGAFLGAVAAEMLLSGKDRNQAIQAGIGTLLGFFVGVFLKFLLALVMIIAWWQLVL